MRETVEHFDDPRLDDYRNLPDRVLLAERGLFIAEGRLVVARLLASVRFATRSLMLTPAAAEAMSAALGAREDLRVFLVDQRTMNQVTGFNLHRGCLAVGVRPAEPDPAALAREARLLLALERVGNADNVGSIFRNGAAFGADAVLLSSDCADPLYRKALRTSMGAALQIPFARADHWPATLEACRDAGLRLVGLTPAAHARPVADVAARLDGERVALIVGHEGDGLSSATLGRCDIVARIPMRPAVDSLNVATAAAIALYALR